MAGRKRPAAPGLDCRRIPALSWILHRGSLAGAGRQLTPVCAAVWRRGMTVARSEDLIKLTMANLREPEVG